MYCTAAKSFRLGFAVALILTAWGLAPMTFGQVTPDYWLNPKGGSYADDANWSLGAPGAYPNFNLGATNGYSVLLSSGEFAINPVIETDNPTFQLGGGTFTADYLDVCDGAGTAGSLTLDGPGKFYQDIDPSYINVGNGSNAAQLIVNQATVNQDGLQSGLYVAPGSTLTVENGGTVEQTDLGGQAMNIANLVVNSGTVTSQGNDIYFGSATISNGSTVAASGSGGILNISGSVYLDGSNLSATSAIVFGSSASLTVTDGGYLNAFPYLTLPHMTDIASGLVQGGYVTFGSSLTMQLNLGLVKVFEGGNTLSAYDELVTTAPGEPSGTLNLDFPTGFSPVIGDVFNLFYWGDGVDSAFSQVNTPALPPGEYWDLSDLYTTGTVSIVPEPTSIALMLAAGGLLLRRRAARTPQPFSIRKIRRFV